MKKVDSKMLAGAAAAEASLAREEVTELEEALPEGHPLREQVDRFKAELNGDLSGLPENHPLLRELRAARDRYEQSLAEETDEMQDKAREVRKAKKLERQEARKQRIIHEEEEAETKRTAATNVNNEIDSALASIRSLYKTLADNEVGLNIEPINRARALRLKRMLYAVERGLSESRMGRV